MELANSSKPATQNSQRRFPNEIFAIIIRYLRHDHSTLCSTALVCKTFASLSQQQIFRRVDLSPPTGKSLVKPFAALLRDPHTASLRRLIKTLDLATQHDDEDVEKVVFIFQRLPSLTELILDMNNLHIEEHFQAVGMHMGKKLEALWIDVPIAGVEDFRAFQYMLASLTVLKLLALHGYFVVEDVEGLDKMSIILPSSLIALYLTGIYYEDYFGLVERGVATSYPPMLGTLFLEHRVEHSFESKLWGTLRPETRIVLDMGSCSALDSQPESVATFKRIALTFVQGLKASQLTLFCSQSQSLAFWFKHLILYFPDSVCEISIDFNAGAADGPVDPVSNLADWAGLDQVLMKRCQRGLLKRIWIRCTSRTNPLARSNLSKPSSNFGDRIDRTILDRIRTLLPETEAAGILEVDSDRLFFESY